MNTSTFKNDIDSTIDQASEKLTDATHSVREKAEGMGRKALERVNDSRVSAASGLENAASAIHQRADSLPGGEKVQNLAHSTAEKLASTAEYMRTHEVKDFVTDVEGLVRRNPGQSLLAACVIGFFAGRMFSRDQY